MNNFEKPHFLSDEEKKALIAGMREAASGKNEQNKPKEKVEDKPLKAGGWLAEWEEKQQEDEERRRRLSGQN